LACLSRASEGTSALTGWATACDSAGVTSSERSTPERSPATRPDSPALSNDLLAVAGVLHGEFDARLGAAVVDTEIHRVADQFTDAPIRAFVPLLVRRYVGDELDEQTEQEQTAPAAADTAGPDA